MIDQEMEIGLRAISVPLRDASEKVVAAIGLSIRDPFMETGELVTRFLEPKFSTAGIDQRSCAAIVACKISHGGDVLEMEQPLHRGGRS